MQRKRNVLAGLVLVVLLAGCGSGTKTSGYTPDSLAKSVTHEISKNGRVTSMVCVQVKDTNTYRCNGDFVPTVATEKHKVKSIDTAAFTDRDWQALVDGDSGPISLEVTVAKDGSWVSQSS